MIVLSTVKCFNPSISGFKLSSLRETGAVQDRVGTAAKSTSFDQLGVDELKVVKYTSAESGLDYRLILAIMKQESQFEYDAVSSRGAEGLMQLMPVTNAEISEKLNLEGMHHPKENIQAGVYYFSQLFDLFRNCAPMDRLSLALAAYNAGPSRIYDAQVLAAYMGENPRSWQSIENILPLLSKRFYSLHQSVWADGKPRSGYFGSYRQTVLYVENTLSIYHGYQQVLE